MQRKLPIGPAVREIYRRLLQDFGYTAKVVASWNMISLVLPLLTITAAGDRDDQKGLSIVIFAASSLTLPVLWHHRQLRPDVPGLSIRDWIFRSVRYWWELFSICGLAGLVYAPALMVGAFANVSLEKFLDSFELQKPDDAIMLNAALAVVVLAVASTFSRLCLVLPAVALGVSDFGKWASWKHTRGNSLRLLSAWIFTTLPLAAPILIYLYVDLVDEVKGLDSDTLSFALLAITICLCSVFLLSTLSLMSVAYAFLVENKPIAPPARSETTGVVARSRRSLSAPSPLKP